MRALGVSGGWMFFEHAGDAVAVDLKAGDVTDVFAASQLDGHGGFAPAGHTAEERRAMLLARSALATQVDPLRTFAIPETVRANVRQAQYWTKVYSRPVELPLVATGASRVPPLSVQCVAQGCLDLELGEEDRARALALADGSEVPERLITQMNAYFSRHRRERVSPAEWLSWGGDSGRVWAAKVASAGGKGETTVSSVLADEKQIDYDTLRLLPRAFSVLNGPHTSECDGNGSCSCGGSKSSAHYPSSRALTYLSLGGDAGRDWARRIIRRVEAEALLAAGYDPDANVVDDDGEVPDSESFDGDAPHVYTPARGNPELCTFCGTGEMDERHQGDAVDYSQADITPDDAHYFSETLKDPDKCEICGKAVDDTLHKQAALADYYANKTEIDKKIAETQQYWEGKAAEGAGPEQPVTSAAETFGVDWVEGQPEDLFERASAVDEEMDTLFWQRRGSEDDDPLTYYAAYTGGDQMMVDQIYVSDGGMFYSFDPVHKTWEQTRLSTPEQIYEIDDETAAAAIRAMAVYPDEPVDLREVDPGEALMMADAVQFIDDGMNDRVVIVQASGVTFDVFAEDDGYTPEERAANAKKQVRDAGGRFAKAGSRIAVGSDARPGVVTKIDPQTQQIQVNFDDGASEWVDAKSTRVLPETAPAPADQRPLDTSKIEGKPRATANTPKAMLPSMLPPMDRDSLNAVVENYPNFIEKERAGGAARQAAQDAQDAESKARYEAQVKKIEEDYQRRLEAIHAKGKPVRDWVNKVYSKLKSRYGRGVVRGVNQNAMLAAGKPITDPAQSDVAPVYMAEVDEANQQAVLELLAMVPASSEGNQAQVLRYTATGWINDPKVLRQLQSSAPPAIVALDEAAFNDTLAQVKEFYKTPEGKAEAEAEAKESQSQVASMLEVWGEYGELVAAGVPGIEDTPSDRAAVNRLKRYWTVGAGGAKIGWNTPGDWTRCNRHLKKYMHKPGQSEGYCAKLHHEMTGTWPGDRRNVGRRGSAGPRILDTKVLTSNQVIEYSALVAAANAMCAGVEAPEDVHEVPTVLTGAPFRIPILAPVGVKSGDGRHFAPLSLSVRDLPLPLMWQVQTGEGHDDSVIVGRIDSIDRSEDGSLVNARGVFDVGPYGQEAERLVRHKFLRGVSVDLDNFEAEARSAEQLSERDEDDVIRIKADDMTVTSGRVMGATLVAKPAFQEVTIELLEDQLSQEEETMVADGTYIGTPGTEAETQEMVRSALTAAGIPIHPPTEWFDDPSLRTETPLTIDDSGRVFGHIATWNTDHIGLPFSTRPPKSRSNYAYFHTGLLRTDDGTDIPVGQITLAGGHAPLDSDAAMAVKHYDDTASAMCDVHAGEDAYGIWVAGALRPNVTGDQIRAIRASCPSGDWRPINGRLEMVAICQVNVPGFPVTRARVASGHVYALVAAGTSLLSRLRTEAPDSQLSMLLDRIEALEAPQREAINAAREAALARINPVREEHNAQLAAAREAALNRFSRTRSPEATAARERVAALLSDDGSFFRDISADKRKELAKKGHAMPNGGYPITTAGDLKNAIRAYGRAASGEKAAVRRHIKKRARALGKTDLIPESWASIADPFSDLAGDINDLAARLALVSGATHVPIILHGDMTVLDNADILVAAGGRYPDGTPWNPQNHPRDEKGQFRQVIAELKSDLEGEVGTDEAVQGLDVVEQKANQGDSDAAQQAANDVLDMVDKLAANTEDKDLVKTLREGYGNLAEAVANLPLVFGDLNQKYRFSDLPPELKGLIQDLYKRADTLLNPDDLAKAGGKISEFMAGGDVLSQPEISAVLSRILRFLI